MPKIECPVCEARFQISKTVREDRKLKCTGCGNIFLCREGRVADTKRRSSQVAPAGQSAKPPVAAQKSAPSNQTQDAGRPTESSTPNIPKTGPSTAEQEPPTLSVAEPKSLYAPQDNGPSSSAAEQVPAIAENASFELNPRLADARLKSVRKKSNVASLIWISLLAMAAVGLALYFFYVVNRQTPANTENAKLEFSDPVSQMPAAQAPTSPPPARDPGPPDPSATDANSTPPAEFGGPINEEHAPDWLKDAAPKQAMTRNGNREPSAKNVNRTPDFSGPAQNQEKFLVEGSTSWPDKSKRLVWNKMQPRLVRLISERPNGKSESMGLIVDSRGWVATSLQSIAGATSIEVRQVHSHDMLFDDERLFKDKARGVIAKDEALDLAILSVNRKFVVALDDVEMPENDTVVAGQRFIAPLFPGPYSRAVLREVQVDKRNNFQQFSASEQEILTDVGMNEEGLKYVSYQATTPTPPLDGQSILAGAPLFDSDYRLVGITTSVRLNQVPLAVSSVHLARILKMSDGKTSPLSSLVATGQDASPDTGNLPPDSRPYSDPSNPLRKLTFNLNQVGSDCEAFRWQPRSEAQFDKLCQLLKLSINLESRIASDKVEEKIRDDVRKQTNHWMNLIDKNIAGRFDNDSAQIFNELALKAMDKPGAFFTVFAKVKYAAFDGPRLRNEDAVTFELLGSSRLMIVPHDRQMPKLLPDSKWLVLCYPLDPDSLKITDNGVNLPANIGRAAFLFGPL